MRFISRLFWFCIILCIIAFALSYFLPENQQITKIITIKAPAEIIYKQLVSAQNFTKTFLPHNSINNNKTDTTEALIGSSFTWKEDSFVNNEAIITLTGLKPDKEVDHQIILKGLKEMHAESKIILHESDGTTNVNWTFTLLTPRPWNVGNLFYDLEKEKGKDFENGLTTLKLFSEKSTKF